MRVPQLTFIDSMAPKTRYATTRRYANPSEFQHYASGIPISDLARRLRVTQTTIRAWLDCTRFTPWWATEVLRLQQMEFLERMRQMNMMQYKSRLGVVAGHVIRLPVASRAQPETIQNQRERA